jgi:hypothetical protein
VRLQRLYCSLPIASPWAGRKIEMNERLFPWSAVAALDGRTWVLADRLTQLNECPLSRTAAQ